MTRVLSTAAERIRCGQGKPREDYSSRETSGQRTTSFRDLNSRFVPLYQPLTRS